MAGSFIPPDLFANKTAPPTMGVENMTGEHWTFKPLENQHVHQCHFE